PLPYIQRLFGIRRIQRRHIDHSRREGFAIPTQLPNHISEIFMPFLSNPWTITTELTELFGRHTEVTQRFGEKGQRSLAQQLGIDCQVTYPANRHTVQRSESGMKLKNVFAPA